VPVPTRPTSLTRADIGLPDGFVVLFAFSVRSIFQRKNPEAAIAAYCQAFGPGDGAHLVLKTIGGDEHWEDVERLRYLASGRPDIHIVHEQVRAVEVRAMIELCDCYLSLHRSEGFGLSIAEAMARGRPVVATGWSGNMDFMDERTAHLVPYELVPIPDGCAPYSNTGEWAEPDVDAAAAALRAVHDDRDAARALGDRARRHIAETRSFEAGAASLRNSFDAMRRAWVRP
jgi:glycosyltransferase involved in cell wall biosynthesis